MRLKWVFISGSCAVLAACGSNTGHGTIRTDSAGVDIVLYAGADRPLTWPLDTLFMLGGVGVEPSDSVFYGPSWVDADDAGNIYVLDGDTSRVLVYDSMGTWKRSMGGRGGGPGKFEMGIAMAVSPQGIVSVFDIAKRALVRYDSAGETIQQIGLEGPYSGGLIHEDGTHHLLVLRDRQPGAGTMVQRLIRATDTDTTVLGVAEQPVSERFRLESCGIGFNGRPPIFAASMEWAAHGSLTVFAAGAAYTVQVMEGDSLIRFIRRDAAPIPGTAERALASLGDGWTVTVGGTPRVCEAQEVVDKQGVADVVPAVSKVAVAPDGTIWISRNTSRHDQTLIDIFDPQGSYLGTLPPEYPFPDTFISPNTIVVREQDEMDIDVVVAYRLERVSR